MKRLYLLSMDFSFWHCKSLTDLDTCPMLTYARLCVCAQIHTIKPVCRLHALPNHPHVTYFHTKGHVFPPPALLLKRSPSSSRSTGHTFATFLDPYNGRPLPAQVATTVGMYFFGVSPLGLPCIPVLCSCPSSPRLDGAFPPTQGFLGFEPLSVSVTV